MESDIDLLKIDIDKDLLKPFEGSVKMSCYDSIEYVKDMGTPVRFEAVICGFESGKVFARNLRNKQKAIF